MAWNGLIAVIGNCVEKVTHNYWLFLMHFLNKSPKPKTVKFYCLFLTCRIRETDYIYFLNDELYCKYLTVKEFLDIYHLDNKSVASLETRMWHDKNTQ